MRSKDCYKKIKEKTMIIVSLAASIASVIRISHSITAKAGYQSKSSLITGCAVPPVIKEMHHEKNSKITI